MEKHTDSNYLLSDEQLNETFSFMEEYIDSHMDIPEQDIYVASIEVYPRNLDSNKTRFITQFTRTVLWGVEPEIDLYNQLVTIVESYPSSALKRAILTSYNRLLEDVLGRLETVEKDIKDKYPSCLHIYFKAPDLFDDGYCITIDDLRDKLLFSTSVIKEFLASSDMNLELVEAEPTPLPTDSELTGQPYYQRLKIVAHKRALSYSRRHEWFKETPEQTAARELLYKGYKALELSYSILSHGNHEQLRDLSTISHNIGTKDLSVPLLFASLFQFNRREDIFLNSSVSPSPEVKMLEDVKESIEKIDTRKNYRCGVLRFMLESFGVTDKESMSKLLEFVVQPQEEWSGGHAGKGKRTIYDLISCKQYKFDKCLYDIRETLDKYEIEYPQGLLEYIDLFRARETR